MVYTSIDYFPPYICATGKRSLAGKRAPKTPVPMGFLAILGPCESGISPNPPGSLSLPDLWALALRAPRHSCTANSPSFPPICDPDIPSWGTAQFVSSTARDVQQLSSTARVMQEHSSIARFIQELSSAWFHSHILILKCFLFLIYLQPFAIFPSPHLPHLTATRTFSSVNSPSFPLLLGHHIWPGLHHYSQWHNSTFSTFLSTAFPGHHLSQGYISKVTRITPRSQLFFPCIPISLLLQSF